MAGTCQEYSFSYLPVGTISYCNLDFPGTFKGLAIFFCIFKEGGIQSLLSQNKIEILETINKRKFLSYKLTFVLSYISTIKWNM